MSFIHVSAGVYSEEVDFSEYAKSIDTPRLGIVTVSERGLEGVEGAKISIQTYDAYKVIAGNAIDESYGSYAIKSFFDNGKGSVYQSRVFKLTEGGEIDSATRAKTSVKDDNFTPETKLEIEAYSLGKWGNSLKVYVEPNTKLYPDGFDLRVTETVEGKEKEVHYFRNLNFEPLSNSYVERQVNVSRWIRVKDMITTSNIVKQTLSLEGGVDGHSTLQDQDYISAIHNFKDTDLDILIIPGNTSSTVISAALNFCEKNYVFGIFDTPEGLDVQGVVDYRQNLGGEAFNSSYGAMYYPWIEAKDFRTGVKKAFPPSGFVAGAFTRGNIWSAPAGLERGVLRGIERPITRLEQEDRDILYDNQINPIASFMDAAAVVWGNKTLQVQPSALDRINVRMAVNVIKKNVVAMLRAYLFSDNGPELWGRMARKVNPFLQQVKDKKGIKGFRFVCDSTTNTTESIENNQVIAKLYLEPQKTAETIGIQFVITAQGVNFEEITEPVV